MWHENEIITIFKSYIEEYSVDSLKIKRRHVVYAMIYCMNMKKSVKFSVFYLMKALGIYCRHLF